MKLIEDQNTQDGILDWYWRFKMTKYKYGVYLTNGRMVTVTVEALSPTDGQMMVESQYAGLRVQWMGRA
jgi:hypothetical protein